MSDFITPAELATFGAAVAVVVAVTNTFLYLANDRFDPYAKWAALLAALLATVAARGVPQSIPDGIALAFSALYVFMAAVGGNTVVVDKLAAGGPTEPDGELVAGAPAETRASFWRYW